MHIFFKVQFQPQIPRVSSKRDADPIPGGLLAQKRGKLSGVFPIHFAGTAVLFQLWEVDLLPRFTAILVLLKKLHPR